MKDDPEKDVDKAAASAFPGGMDMDMASMMSMLGKGGGKGGDDGGPGDMESKMMSMLGQLGGGRRGRKVDLAAEGRGDSGQAAAGGRSNEEGRGGEVQARLAARQGAWRGADRRRAGRHYRGRRVHVVHSARRDGAAGHANQAEGGRLALLP
eukprot:CAMPEP_0195126964 /NCGR_PEP_ID=MMETSP0448-20130528/136040_1 /TAXON_ID=66468 /ORGANISM="Heterocapsa triquestra, Strain CCMP 448" /LENGTH=151 /DNA_ID=CAMNT_0040164673 /DNA_START=21 /DNA_END=472 /DNA_ORIENTATION=+